MPLHKDLRASWPPPAPGEDIVTYEFGYVGSNQSLNIIQTVTAPVAEVFFELWSSVPIIPGGLPNGQFYFYVLSVDSFGRRSDPPTKTLYHWTLPAPPVSPLELTITEV